MHLKCSLGWHTWKGYKCQVCRKMDKIRYIADTAKICEEAVAGSFGFHVPRSEWSVTHSRNSIHIEVPVGGYDCGYYNNSCFPANSGVRALVEGRADRVFEALTDRVYSDFPFLIHVSVWILIAEQRSSVYSCVFTPQNLVEYSGKKSTAPSKYWTVSYDKTADITWKKTTYW